MEQKPRAGAIDILTTLVALMALAALTVLSLSSVAPPAPRGADAPEGDFSAARAFVHVERVASGPHVAGSAAAADVRGYLESTLRGLGLTPQVQDAVGATDALGDLYAMARVRNVVAVLPGTDSTGRVFLVVHYDSAQVSPGASDDGAGVATVLEAARALTLDPRPRNDVVLVFTDAEEACLCGAEAFIDQHPLAAAGGVVLNLEARGTGGPAIMFETSAGNAGVVGVYGDAVAHPVATSFAVEVYRILPNDTDFTPFLAAGRFTGLNTAFIDGSAAYHTPLDNPAHLDKASLQHHGDNALALARAFAAADLRELSRPSGGDATYFPVLKQLVRYPGWLVWPFAGLAVLAVALLAITATRATAAGATAAGATAAGATAAGATATRTARGAGVTSWPRLAAGFGLGLVPLLAAPVAAQLLWSLLVALRPDYATMIDPWRPQWLRGAVVALVATVLLTWYGLLRRRLGAWSLAIGGLGWLAVIGVLLAALTPGGSYLAALPALAGAVAAIAALRLRGRIAGIAALTAGAAVAVLILAPTVLLFFPALGLATGGAAALFAVMLGIAVLPVLDRLYPSVRSEPAGVEPGGVESGGVDDPAGSPDRPRPAGGKGRRIRSAVPASVAPASVAAALALAMLAAGLGADRFDPAHPVPAQLMYVLDADTGQARWVSAEREPGAWTSRYVTGREDLASSFPMLDDDLATGPAEAAALPAPVLEVVADSVSGGQRTLTLTLTPARPARLVFLHIESDPATSRAPVVRASVAGRDVPVQASTDAAGFGVLFHAPGPGGVTMTLVLAQTGPVRVRVMDGSDGLAGLPGFTARPPDVGVLGSHESELVLVARTYTV